MSTLFGGLAAKVKEKALNAERERVAKEAQLALEAEQQNQRQEEAKKRLHDVYLEVDSMVTEVLSEFATALGLSEKVASYKDEESLWAIWFYDGRWPEITGEVGGSFGPLIGHNIPFTDTVVKLVGESEKFWFEVFTMGHWISLRSNDYEIEYDFGEYEYDFKERTAGTSKDQLVHLLGQVEYLI